MQIAPPPHLLASPGKRDALDAGLGDDPTDTTHRRIAAVETDMETMDEEDDVVDFDSDEEWDENAVDEETRNGILAGKDTEMDAMDQFGIYEIFEGDLGPSKKVLTTRWENGRRADGWRCRFVAREFKAMNKALTGLYTPGSTTSTGRLIDLHIVQNKLKAMILDADHAYFHADEDEEVYTHTPVE